MIIYKSIVFKTFNLAVCLGLLSQVCLSQSETSGATKQSISPTQSLGSSSERDPITVSSQDTLHLYDSLFVGFTLLDSIMSDYQVFITGENHSFTASNARIWLKMIKYLHAHAGVRNIMFEYGNSYGVLVNEYLKTGDTLLYNSLSNFTYTEYSEVIKELKDFNDSLPIRDKLYFTGIDLDRGVYPIAKALNQLLPDDEIEVPDSIAIHIASIKSLAPYNDFKLDQDENVNYNGFQFKTGSTLELIHKNFKRRKEDYSQYLGEDYTAFEQIILTEYNARQRWQALQTAGAIQEYHFREQYMYQRFMEEYQTHDGNWFGQFGRCHTTQDIQKDNSCEWFTFSSLADRIEGSNEEELRNNVSTIGIVYDEDRNFGPSKKETKNIFNKYFEDMESNSVVLLDLKMDTALDQSFSEDFNLLLLNNYKERGEAFNNNSNNKNRESNTTYSIYYGMYSPNIGTLNSFFRAQNVTSDFNAGNQTFGYGALVKNGRYTTTTNGVLFASDEASLLPLGPSSVATVYNLKGMTFNQGLMYSLLPDIRMFDFRPGASLGYSRFELTNTENAPSRNALQQGFLGNTRINKYVNDAFVIDALLDADIELGIFSIGGRIGYSFDVSNKKWKTADERLDASPATSFTGWYNYVKLGVRL